TVRDYLLKMLKILLFVVRNFHVRCRQRYLVHLGSPPGLAAPLAPICAGSIGGALGRRVVDAGCESSAEPRPSASVSPLTFAYCSVAARELLWSSPLDGWSEAWTCGFTRTLVVGVPWRWQRTKPPEAIAYGGGSTVRHTSITKGHRGWKRQPDGTALNFGTAPLRAL